MNEHSERANDRRISLAPLDFEQAMKGLLAAGPHPKDETDNAPEAIKQHHGLKHKRRRRKSDAPAEPTTD